MESPSSLRSSSAWFPARRTRIPRTCRFGRRRKCNFFLSVLRPTSSRGMSTAAAPPIPAPTTRVNKLLNSKTSKNLAYLVNPLSQSAPKGLVARSTLNTIRYFTKLIFWRLVRYFVSRPIAFFVWMTSERLDFGGREVDPVVWYRGGREV